MFFLVVDFSLQLTPDVFGLSLMGKVSLEVYRS
jgi:hypothetical protein